MLGGGILVIRHEDGPPHDVAGSNHGHHPDLRRWDLGGMMRRMLLTSLQLVLKWFRNKQAPRLSLTARIEGPPLHRGASASKKDGWLLPFQSPFQASSYLIRGWPAWSPTARVQRGPSQAARCASTGDQLTSPSKLARLFPKRGGLGWSLTAHVERPQFYRGGSVSTRDHPGLPVTSL